jgi:hypothetical protein
MKVVGLKAEAIESRLLMGVQTVHIRFTVERISQSAPQCEAHCQAGQGLCVMWSLVCQSDAR